jgi:hypothetical protein
MHAVTTRAKKETMEQAGSTLQLVREPHRAHCGLSMPRTMVPLAAPSLRPTQLVKEKE